MELNERINALDGELKLVKAEIKTVLIDLRETMNNYENPFVNVEQLGKVKDKEREVIKEEKEEESRIREERIPVKQEEEEPAFKPEPEYVPEYEPEYEPEVAPAPRSRSVAKTDTDRARMDKVEKAQFKVKGTEKKIDIFTLTQLMKWADNSLADIGKDKLNEVIALYNITGRLPAEMKGLITKIEDLSEVNHVDKEQIEMKDCILAIYQLDRIVTGETGAQAPLMLSEDDLEKWLKVR